MISKYSHRELNWVDIESPTEEEVAYILEEYTIPLFIKEEIARKPKEDIVRLDHGFIFAYLNPPQFPLDENKDNRLIFIANDNFIIIIHDEPIQALGEFAKEVELDTITEERLETNDSRLLFAHLLKNLYINSQKQLVEKEIEIKNLKKQLIKNKEKLRLFRWLFIISLMAIILIVCL